MFPRVLFPRLSRSASGAVLAALVALAAIPALTGAQGAGTRDITVVDKVRAVKFVHVQAEDSARGERLAPGDRVLTRQSLFDQDRRALGTLFTDCTNVGAAAQVFDATLQCTSTYRFRDGEVVSAGVVRLGAGPTTGFPIVGGSGAYRGAQGEVSASAPLKGYDSVDVLHLDG